MAEFKKVSTVDELSPGQCLTAVVNDRYVGVYNVVAFLCNGRCLPAPGGPSGKRYAEWMCREVSAARYAV